MSDADRLVMAYMEFPNTLGARHVGRFRAAAAEYVPPFHMRSPGIESRGSRHVFVFGASFEMVGRCAVQRWANAVAALAGVPAPLVGEGRRWNHPHLRIAA